MDRGSSRYDILKLEKLIRNYINNKDNSTSKTELSFMVIEGEDLIETLDNLNFETEKETEENKKSKVQYEEKCNDYTNLEEKYKELEKKYNKLEEAYNENLSQDIKKLIEGKEGPFVDKIKKILEE